LRDQILATAIEVINESGFRFTMSDLVKRLSISKSTLYAHFKSKEELVGAIVDLSLANVRQQEKSILENDTLNAAEKLKAITAIYPPMTVSVRVMHDLKRYFPKEWEKGEQHRIEKWNAIESLIKQGIKAGYFRPVDLTILNIIHNGTVKELMDDKDFFIHNSLSFYDAMNKVADILLWGIMNPDGSESEPRSSQVLTEAESYET
jgi:AcrR family transcriptional regulator